MAVVETITKWLKDSAGKIVVPKTYASCVYNANGETVEARMNYIQQQLDSCGGCHDGFLTYGGVGVGGVATYYELEKAPNQPTS